MQENLKEVLKQQLRDVHMPIDIDWWPLAYGWWILATLLLLCFGGLSFYLIKHHAQNRYRKIALNELKASYQDWLQAQQSIVNLNLKYNSSSTYLINANKLLRRCVMNRQHKNHLVATTGDRWIEILNQMSNVKLSTAAQVAIVEQCYQTMPTVDINQLHTELSTWIKSHKPPSSTKAINQQNTDTEIRSTNHA